MLKFSGTGFRDAEINITFSYRVLFRRAGTGSLPPETIQITGFVKFITASYALSTVG